MTTTSKVILGLVGAAAVGVCLGMLLAPEKGTDTRRRITDTANDWASHLGDLFANAKGELTKLKGKGQQMATDATNAYNNATENFS